MIILPLGVERLRTEETVYEKLGCNLKGFRI